MSEGLLKLNTHLYDQLDMKALQRALNIQLPLVGQIGSVRASVLGMHCYQFALSANCAHVDRIINLLNEYRADWPEALRNEISACARLRAAGNSEESVHRVYQSEAQHVLSLAATLVPDAQGVADKLRQYQIYACPHLLGDEGMPGFFTLEEIETLLEPQTRVPSALFARQFSERQRKPELIARELSAHFAEFTL